jgi:hypothetical protein
MLTTQNRSRSLEATATILMPSLRTVLGRVIAPGESGYDEARYDPTNLFRLNQNIPPEIEPSAQ